MNEYLFLDFETRSLVDLPKCGADVYARDPSTEVMCVGFAFGEEPAAILESKDQARIEDHVYGGKKVVAHNANFEFLIWNYCWAKSYPPLTFPELRPEQLICTMAMSLAMALPASLDQASLAVGLNIQKDAKGKRVMLQLSQPRPDGLFWEDFDAPEKFKILFEYCKTDVDVERQLFKRLLPLSTREKELWLLDHTINQRGIMVNQKALRGAQKLLETEKEKLDSKMREVTGNRVASCTAVSQLTDWLKDQGVECEGVAKADLDFLLNSSVAPGVRTALELRKAAAKSSTAKVASLLAGVNLDGRTRGLFQYHGASTGRWAGRRTQLQNLPRSKMDNEAIEDFFKVMERIDERSVSS